MIATIRADMITLSMVPPPDDTGKRDRERFFTQRVPVSSALRGMPRAEALARFCRGRRVLHVGCAGWPLAEGASSLHVALGRTAASIDGFDTQARALEALRPHLPKDALLTSRWRDVATRRYDVVLVPEVLEHVADAGTFLKRVGRLSAERLVVSAPDAYTCGRRRHFQYDRAREIVTEIVHPDHRCWYSPFTLRAAVMRATGWKMDRMWFVDPASILGSFRPR